MAAKKKKTASSPDDGLQALDPILADISARLSDLESAQEEELSRGLEDCLELACRAHSLASTGGRPWLAAWIALQKASLHSDLAQFLRGSESEAQIESAMDLILETAVSIPDLPANLDQAASLYSTLIGILLRIRGFFEDESQIQALDDLVRGCAETLGQLIAHSQFLKEQAADLLLASRILEVLDDLEGTPDQGKDSRDLDQQAADLISLAGADPAQLAPLSREGR